jgi:DNA-binding SARP family transcriptional activator
LAGASAKGKTKLATTRHRFEGGSVTAIAQSVSPDPAAAAAPTNREPAEATHAPASLVRQAWQCAQQALDRNDWDRAGTHLARAALLAHASKDPLAPTIREAERFVARLSELDRQRAYHRNAYAQAERAMREACDELHTLLRSTPTQSEPASSAWWQRILAAAGLRAFSPVPGAEAWPATPAASFTQSPAELPTEPARPDDVLPPSPAPIHTLPRPMLTVHMLGRLRVAINDQPIERCSNRGRAVLAYLLVHRHQPVLRDVLMDIFWPDATPAAARNSLNVALHSLRRSFRRLSDVPVIVFQDGAYSLNPELVTWLDVEEFVQHAELGYRREAEGDVEAAIVEYEAAAALYEGDFLSENRYEDWTMLPREKLRLTYLDILDRLSHIYLDRKRFAACITLCQLILARDACREDIHCRLMRCYARQNQYPAAIRQYQACVEALQREISVEPAEATTLLYERICRHEAV